MPSMSIEVEIIRPTRVIDDAIRGILTYMWVSQSDERKAELEALKREREKARRLDEKGWMLKRGN